MTKTLEISLAILASLGGGAGIIFALSKHLAGLWASRTIARERATFETAIEKLRGDLQRELELIRVTQSRETELLIRKRDAYRGLARSLRVFQTRSEGRASVEEKHAFLAAYDEAALWASEEVVHALGALLDLLADTTEKRERGLPAPPNEAKQSALLACITAMRKDSGFHDTKYRHRLVSF